MSMLVMSLLVFNFYASMLVSTLIGATTKNKIKTLENLADSDFRVGFDGDDTSIPSFLNVRGLFFSFVWFYSVDFQDIRNDFIHFLTFQRQLNYQSIAILSIERKTNGYFFRSKRVFGWLNMNNLPFTVNRWLHIRWFWKYFRHLNYAIWMCCHFGSASQWHSLYGRNHHFTRYLASSNVILLHIVYHHQSTQS